MRAEKRAGCSVCQLPEAITEQLKAARKKEISRDTQVAWLQQCGFAVAKSDLEKHVNSRHDQ